MFLGITDCGDGGWKVIIVAVVLISLQILMVTGRFSSRMLKKVGLKVDDYVLLFATAFTIVLCALALVCKLLNQRVRQTEILTTDNSP